MPQVAACASPPARSPTATAHVLDRLRSFAMQDPSIERTAWRGKAHRERSELQNAQAIGSVPTSSKAKHAIHGSPQDLAVDAPWLPTGGPATRSRTDGMIGRRTLVQRFLDLHEVIIDQDGHREARPLRSKDIGGMGGHPHRRSGTDPLSSAWLRSRKSLSPVSCVRRSTRESRR
jgi:hypothetical protein